MQQNRNFHLRTYLSPCSKGSKKQDTLPSADHLLAFHLLQGENIKLTSRKPKTTKCCKNYVHNLQRAAAFPPVLTAARGCPRAKQEGHIMFSLLPTGVENRSPLNISLVHLLLPEQMERSSTNRIQSLKLLTVTCVLSCSEHVHPPRTTQTLLRHS